jgi:hypothetical protein
MRKQALWRSAEHLIAPGTGERARYRQCTLPVLPWLAAGLLVGGILVAVAGVAPIAVPLRRASPPRHL